MRLIGLTVENFRCYRAATSIRFDDLTAIVGRNDVGKSSLMDAMAIFFEETKPDKDDACKSGDPDAMRIACEFDQLPDQLVVDTDFPTTLAAEHLLSANGTLIVEKTYKGSNSTPSVSSIVAIAEHPTVDGFSDWLSLKKAELSRRASDLGVDLEGIDKRINALVRSAIWASCGDLKKELVSVPLDVESGKQVWTAIQPYLPTFALFKSDRASTDQDSEAQDPLKAAIREALKEKEAELQQIQAFVVEEVKKIADATVDKLREMDASVADTLDPVVTPKKWETVFSTSITGDEGIPLNKRGSGVRRLVLLNFFRAKAEKDATEKKSSSVVYAIEEPETSQHPRNQRLLLSALRDLSIGDGRQVVTTTHTPMLARYLNQADLRFIEADTVGRRFIREGNHVTSKDIADSLGVLADHKVKVFVGVEGPHDISFLRGISKVLIDEGEAVPDLEQLELDWELVFIPLGGSNLAVWANRLAPFNRPEFHICDRDNPPPADPKYAPHMAAINARDGCQAVTTSKRELENYLHHEAVIEAYAKNNIVLNFQGPFADFDDVPVMVAQAVHAVAGGSAWAGIAVDKQKRKERKAKGVLNNNAVAEMTLARLAQTDPNNEIRGWLSTIAHMMASVDA